MKKVLDSTMVLVTGPAISFVDEEFIDGSLDMANDNEDEIMIDGKAVRVRNAVQVSGNTNPYMRRNTAMLGSIRKEHKDFKTKSGQGEFVSRYVSITKLSEMMTNATDLLVEEGRREEIYRLVQYYIEAVVASLYNGIHGLPPEDIKSMLMYEAMASRVYVAGAAWSLTPNVANSFIGQAFQLESPLFIPKDFFTNARQRGGVVSLEDLPERQSNETLFQEGGYFRGINRGGFEGY